MISSIGRLSGLLGSGEMQIEYGFSANSTTKTTAIIMATVFKSTKFDRYDPIDHALKRYAGNIESGMDSSFGIESQLPDLES